MIPSRTVAIVLAIAGALGGIAVCKQASDGRGADRRGIEALLRELERDLNDKRLFEIFQHLAEGESEAPEHEHRLKDGLWQMSRIEELRFTETEIGFSEEGAMVETVVTGFVASPDGSREPSSSRILLNLVKESDEWKIARKRPEGPVHRLLPLRSVESSAPTEERRK